MFRLDKRKIFLLYQHYLLGNVPNITSENEKDKQRFVWLNNCLKKENFLGEKIGKKLKTGWEFSRLPPLEKSLLVYATYEIFFNHKFDYSKMIIDQLINFSKVYLEEIKYKYINKVLDLLVKEEKFTTTKDV